ncbi:GPR1/FUN34/yaaH family-domain-containing protein [Aspergillus californicus]
MSLEPHRPEKIDRVLERDPKVTIFLQPIAAPAALGLAGFSGSTFITASYIARWWGDESSPTIFFPFVAFWGGLGQFVAGFFGYAARDTLITVIHVLWGSFWMSIGLLYLLVATGALPPHPIHEHFPELAAWMVVLAFFTWSGAIASTARDLILCAVLTTLAIGTTIACCLFAYGGGVRTGMKAAAYFWIISAILAWWRVTVYLLEEAFGNARFIKFFPIFRTSMEQRKPLLVPGFGEPGVKRGMPGLT